MNRRGPEGGILTLLDRGCPWWLPRALLVVLGGLASAGCLIVPTTRRQVVRTSEEVVREGNEDAGALVAEALARDRAVEVRARWRHTCLTRQVLEYETRKSARLWIMNCDSGGDDCMWAYLYAGLAAPVTLLVSGIV